MRALSEGSMQTNVTQYSTEVFNRIYSDLQHSNIAQIL